MKRILALLLLACICLPLLACNPANTSEKPEDLEDNYTFIDNVGDHNFEGGEFVVSLSASAEPGLYNEEQQPNAYQKAVQQRNRLLENRFNVEIVPEVTQGLKADDFANQILIAMLDGNRDQIDMVLVQRWLSGPIAMTGMVCDLRSEVPYVKDSIGVEEWWDPKINNCYTVFGRQYVGVSDINLSAISTTWAVLFNRAHDQDYAASTHKKIDQKYTSLYDLVDDGTWTLDNMNLIVKDFWRDNPQTGLPNERDESDIFGMTVSSKLHFREIFTNAFGYELIENDGENVPTLMQLTTNMATTIMQLKSMLSSSGFSTFPTDDGVKNFSNGGSLLFFASIGKLETETIHDSDVEFGVLPYPKANITQKEYYAGSNDSMSTILIPFTLSDRMTRTGVVVEAMAAESHQSVIPAYYEIILKYNATRDQDSVRMIEKIYRGRRYNLADIHSSTNDFLRVGGEGLSYLLRAMTNASTAQGPADYWDGMKDHYSIGLDNLISAYLELASLVS